MPSMKTKISLLVLLAGACASPSFAQPAFDSSGNSQLNGTYYFRQVLYFISDNAGDLGDVMNVQGNITFNGSGGYTITNGAFLDYASGSSSPVTIPSTTTGTYSVSASGEAIIGAVAPDFASTDQIIGLVAHNGVIIGSSTENGNGYNDLFIAVPVTSTQATNSTLNGTYSVAYFDPTYPGDALFNMTANGAGSIGTVNVTGYVATNSDPNASSSSTETLSGVTYAFTNGAAQLNFGGNANTNLIGGTDLLYVSPDGNFIFGGSYNGFDMFVGVRAGSSSPTTVNGLFYQAGLDLNEAPYSDGYTILDSYFGSFQSFSSGGNVIGHQRLNSPLGYGGTSDFTYYDQFAYGANATSTDLTLGQSYVSSADGTVRIGYGLGPYLGLNVALLGPTLSGSGVYLSPVGDVNAASSAPFTAFLSPGEMVSLYGTGLASTTANASSLPLPTSGGLGNVTVTMNSVPAPLIYVSPTQINAIVPYEIVPGSVVNIQVNNNGSTSNVVSNFANETEVGIFTNNPVGGIGYADVERPSDNYSVVSESNPAIEGETDVLYLAGMGALTSSVTDGSSAPGTTSGSSPADTNLTPQVYVYDTSGNVEQATVSFSGLTPGFAGLYQINFVVPTGLAAGDTSIEVYSSTDSDTLEALLPVATSSSSARPSAAMQHPRMQQRTRKSTRQPKLDGKAPLPRPLLRGRSSTVSGL